MSKMGEVNPWTVADQLEIEALGRHYPVVRKMLLRGGINVNPRAMETATAPDPNDHGYRQRHFNIMQLHPDV